MGFVILVVPCNVRLMLLFIGIVDFAVVVDDVTSERANWSLCLIDHLVR